MLTTFYNHVLEAMDQEKLTLKEVAVKLNEHGIMGVEIDYRDLNPTGLNFNYGLVQELREAGLPVYGTYIFYDWGRHPFDSSYKRKYRELKEAGIRNSLAIPGMVPEGMDTEKARKRMLKNLKKAVEYADSLGITVLMEDFDDSAAPFSTEEGMKYFFDGVPKLKCAFDTGNFFYSDEDALKALPAFSKRTAYVHCKDRSLTVKPGETPKKTVSGTDMYSSAVGDGVIPINKIIEKLRADGYTGDYAIEHFGSKNQLGDMIKSADYLNSLLED